MCQISCPQTTPGQEGGGYFPRGCILYPTKHPHPAVASDFFSLLLSPFYPGLKDYEPQNAKVSPQGLSSNISSVSHVSILFFALGSEVIEMKMDFNFEQRFSSSSSLHLQKHLLHSSTKFRALSSHPHPSFLEQCISPSQCPRPRPAPAPPTPAPCPLPPAPYPPATQLEQPKALG